MWLVAVYLSIYLLHLVYVWTQAVVGNWFGIQVREVGIAVPAVYRRKGKYWTWAFGLLPFTAYTKFRNAEETYDDSDPAYPRPAMHAAAVASWESDAVQKRAVDPHSLQAAPWYARLLILLSGPVSNLLIGLVALLVPVWAGANQLALTSAAESEIHPCAVGGMAVQPAASSLSQQYHLIKNIGANAVWKYALWQNLDGWGGWIGAWATTAACGKASIYFFFTAFGALATILGVANLLPFPILNGGAIVILLFETMRGSPLDPRRLSMIHTLAFLVVATVHVRIFYADFEWLYYLGR